MADRVTVILTDASGSKKVNGKIPTGVPMSQLVSALVTRMELPSGQPYAISHKQTGKELGDSETLLSAGVKDGDTLILTPNVAAGYCRKLDN